LEKKEISEILNFMNALYPNRKIQINSAAIDTWMMMFDGYEKEEVLQAIKNLSRKIKYIPNIPEIVDEIQHVFKTEMRKIGNAVIVRIIFHDEAIPFKFTEQHKLNEFIDFMKTGPEIEEIKRMHINNMLETTPYANITPKAMESYTTRKKKFF